MSIGYFEWPHLQPMVQVKLISTLLSGVEIASVHNNRSFHVGRALNGLYMSCGLRLRGVNRNQIRRWMCSAIDFRRFITQFHSVQNRHIACRISCRYYDISPIFTIIVIYFAASNSERTLFIASAKLFFMLLSSTSASNCGLVAITKLSQ